MIIKPKLSAVFTVQPKPMLACDHDLQPALPLDRVVLLTYSTDWRLSVPLEIDVLVRENDWAAGEGGARVVRGA